MPFEDMGIMRTIPDLVCVEPTDAAMLESLVPQIADYKGAVYVRMFRKKAHKIFDESDTFDLFKAKKIRKGKDCTIICSGIMVKKALDAQKELEQQGYDIGILNTATWKPIDKEMVIECAKESGAIVTAENHNIHNGLGSAVAEVLVENYPVPMKRIGIKDRFGQVGKMDFLEKEYNISISDIVQAVKETIKRKKA